MTIPELDLLEYNVSGLGINDMVVKLGTVADLVSAHAGYQNLPDEVPGPPQFRALAGELHQADQDAVNKDRLKLALRAEKHKDSAVSLTMFGQFAVMRAIKNKDTSYLDNIGFERKKKNVKNKTAHNGPLGAPGSFAVLHGPVSGSVVFRVGRLAGAAHYDVHSCLGDPNNEDSWSLAATFVNTRNMRIDGLEPGKVYQFRVRCLGASGFGPWSNIVKIIVI
jgi:hypothetical protein